MLTNYVESKREEITEYQLCFDDGHNNGYGFPCDKDGNLSKDLSDAAKANYKYCIKHPGEFVRFNKVLNITRLCKEPAHGTCSCGEVVYLTNQYLGACQCPNCGQWYNIFGQELLPPEKWEE